MSRPRPAWTAAPVLLLAVLATNAVARMHVPHDVARDVFVSPDFAIDQTVYGVVRLSEHDQLARSVDGGLNWETWSALPQGQVLRDLALAPGFAQNGILFAATAQGGVFRSDDQGRSWAAINAGLPTLFADSVAVSPDYANDQTVIVATNLGVYRSTDGGTSWQTPTVQTLENSIGHIAFGDDPDTVFASGFVVHRSDDGGDTWQSVNAFPNRIESLAVSPNYSVDETVAVSFGRVGDGVSFGTQGGTVWTPAITGLVDDEVNDVSIGANGMCFAVVPSGVCYRAAQPGATWVPFTEGFGSLTNQTSNHFLGVAVSPELPTDGRVFVAAFDGLFGSTDSGQTWRQYDIYNQRINRRIVVSPDYASDRRVWVANYGGGLMSWRDGVPGLLGTGAGNGLGNGMGGAAGSPAAGPLVAASTPWQTPTTDALTGSPWTQRSETITSLYSSVLGLSPDIADDGTMFYAYHGMWRSEDTGFSWQKLDLPEEVTIPRALALSPDFPSDRTLFIGTTNQGFWRSTDAGDTWTELRGGVPDDIRVKEIVISPTFASDHTLLVGSFAQGVWRSTDGGDTWTDQSGDLDEHHMRALAISPDFAFDGVVVCGTVGGGLYRSADGGDSWTPVNAGLPSGAEAVIESVALSPAFATDQTAFVASAFDGVYISTDGGVSWSPASTGLTAATPRVLALSPEFDTDQTLFVSTHDWVWWSTDAGAGWERLPGLVRVDDEHDSILREGNWFSLQAPGSHGSGVTYSSAVGARLELSFEGDSVAWRAAVGPQGGIARVRVDEEISFVDTYRPQPGADQRLFTRSFERTGQHVIEVTVTGLAHRDSTGTVIPSDGFEYTFR